MRKSLILLAFALPLAFAQKVAINQEAIVVNPNPAPNFNVSVSLNKDRTGNDRPVYQLGDSVQISVRVSQSAYVYLFSVKPNGEITQILPNHYDQQGEDNYLRAGETRVFPPEHSRYSFSIAPPEGLSKVIAVASKVRLDTRQLAQFKSGQNFATSNIGQEGFVRAFGIIVRPVPQQDWVTDTALYYVGSRPQQQPSTATLRIDSNPQQGRAFVDGNFVGYTPTTYQTRPGRHDIRVTRTGYVAFQTSVDLRPGATQTVSANLRPLQRTGTVSFDSQPRGASVYLDGRYVGSTPIGRMSVPAGSHSVRFSLGGYRDANLSFDLAGGQDRQVNVRLSPASGALLIRDNVGGALAFVDGRQVGTIANGSGLLRVEDIDPGMHELTLVAPGYHTYVTGFSVQAGQTTQLYASQSHF
ncbi:MAG: PEGA domain-containing protein [Deinococcales bacterium]